MEVNVKLKNGLSAILFYYYGNLFHFTLFSLFSKLFTASAKFLKELFQSIKEIESFLLLHIHHISEQKAITTQERSILISIYHFFSLLYLLLFFSTSRSLFFFFFFYSGLFFLCQKLKTSSSKHLEE